MTIQTTRLRLRALTDDEIEPFVSMFTDPDVMQYVAPAPISRAKAAAAAQHYRRVHETKGYGWWAIEVNGGSSFGGIIMLKDVEFTAHFTPAIEVGWLLPRENWGNGFATEGARAALHYAFSTLGFDEVVALTTAINAPSQRVMQRLGMTHDPADDFDHPHISNSPLERCVLYRVKGVNT